MRLLPDLALQLRLIRASRVFAIITIGISVLALIGWMLDVDWLIRLPGSTIGMNPVSAISLILAGVSFLILVSNEQLQPRRGVVLFFSVLVLVLGLVKILSLLIDSDWALDNLLFYNEITRGVRDKMSPVTAVCLIFLGSAILLLTTKKSLQVRIAQVFALLIGLAAWLLQLGYIYKVPSFYRETSFYGPMGLYTALAFVCMAIAVLLSRPDQGIMKPLTRLSSGSIVIRLIMPAAVIVPTVLGWLGMFGDWLGIYEAEFGVAVYTLMFIIIFLALAWYTASTLNARDIQRKEVSDALQKSEEELSSIFNGAPDAVVVINENGEVVKWNPEAEKLFLWTRQEAIGSSLRDLVIPDEYKEAHDNGMARFLKSGKANIVGKTVDVKAIRKNKKEFDASIRISPVIIKGHHLFVGFIRDITERKKLENKLTEFNIELKKQVSEKTRQLTEIFERLTDGFIALDSDLRYTYLNKKASELIHRDPAEMLGKHVWSEFPEAIGSSTYHAFNTALKEKKYVVNIDSYEPLGIHQENHIYPSDNGLVVFIRDITEKRKAQMALQEREARYRTLVEEAADAIMVYSPKLNTYVEVNKKAAEMFGYSEEELKTKSPEDFLFHDDPIPVPREKLESGEAISIERRMKRKDGTGLMVETTAKKLPDGNYLAFIRDITERKLAEEQTKRLSDELRVLTNHLQKVREEERTHIAREIHDELGQQLTVMKMDASYVNKKIGEDQPLIKEKMNELLKMIDHTVKSIRRISSELRPSLLDDLGLIAAMEWHLDEFERRSGISKEFHSEVQALDLPDNVKINLFRIFQESLTNVARHSGGTHVIVKLNKSENELILTITDNGKGFDKENAGKKTLGILGMKERTIMIGGTYDIAGVAGEGTTVTVAIPETNLIKQDNYA